MTDPIDRLLDKIDLEFDTGCWLWTGTITYAGYGQLFVNGRHWRAHRLSYEVLVESIPEGLVIDHLCRVRNCVNPDHLEPVTQAVNHHRGVLPAVNKAKAAERTGCPSGHDWTISGATRVNRAGARVCRACERERSRQRTAARRRARSILTGEIR